MDRKTFDRWVNLKEKDLRGEGLVVAEGRLVTQRLLEARWPLEVLAVEGEIPAEWVPLIPAGTAVLNLTRGEMAVLAGFDFHRGFLALARRPAPLPLLTFLEARPLARRLVAAPDLTDPENLGSLYRSAHALGWDAVVIGPESCDPYSRRSLKVSMGAVLSLPTVTVTGPGELADLDCGGWTRAAAILTAEAADLETYRAPDRLVLLVGNEARGLGPEWAAGAQPLVIPMRAGADSLNAGVAAGIFLHKLAPKS